MSRQLNKAGISIKCNLHISSRNRNDRKLNCFITMLINDNCFFNNTWILIYLASRFKFFADLNVICRFLGCLVINKKLA